MTNRKTRAAVLGATGYSGAELCVLLARHPHAEIVSVFSSGKKDARPVPFARLHPLLGVAAGPDAEPFSTQRLGASRPDVVFLATPNETSAEVAPKILESGAKVIDISGAFRLRDAADYPKWYGFEHPAPGLLAEAVYGLTEWCGEELAGARLVANPRRVTTLSSRRSSTAMRASPVLPGRRLASSKYLRN